MNSACSVIILVVITVIILSVCDQVEITGGDWQPIVSGPPRGEFSIAFKPKQATGCQSKYVAAKGDTQWQVAVRYAGNYDKHLWLRNMRYANGLAPDDDSLQPGQRLCVFW